MFFSQLSPLSFDQKNFIERMLLDFSVKAKNTVLYPNFLYTETRHVTGAEIHTGIVNMGKKSSADGLQAVKDILPHSAGAATLVDSTMNFHNAESTLRRCAQVIQNRHVPNDETNVDWEYLINETYSINNGRILTKYKKAGYFRESDIKISNGCIYDSGSGHDESVVRGTNTLRNTLLRCISTDICLDLNLGVRRNGVNRWSNPIEGGITHSSYLHIIQSNSINPFYDYEQGLTNRRNLPQNVGVLHVDKYPHPSWNIPGMAMFPRPQDIYLPYIGTDGYVKDDFLYNKTEFHLRICESDYRFCFLKI